MKEINEDTEEMRIIGAWLACYEFWSLNKKGYGHLPKVFLVKTRRKEKPNIFSTNTHSSRACQRLSLLDYLRTHCLSLLQRSLSIKVADKLILPQGHLLGAVWQQSGSIVNQYCIN